MVESGDRGRKRRSGRALRRAVATAPAERGKGGDAGSCPRIAFSADRPGGEASQKEVLRVSNFSNCDDRSKSMRDTYNPPGFNIDHDKTTSGRVKKRYSRVVVRACAHRSRAPNTRMRLFFVPGAALQQRGTRRKRQGSGWVTQFGLLLRRSWKQATRDKFSAAARRDRFCKSKHEKNPSV